MAEFDFTIQHLPGVLNMAADALSRGVSSIVTDSSFQIAKRRHEQYGHPGKKRLALLLQSTRDAEEMRNLEDVCHEVITNCRTCGEVKPKWIKPAQKTHHSINGSMGKIVH